MLETAERMHETLSSDSAHSAFFRFNLFSFFVFFCFSFLLELIVRFEICNTEARRYTINARLVVVQGERNFVYTFSVAV